MMAAGVSLIIMSGTYLGASTKEDEAVEPQTSRGVELPVWGPGEMQGEFDVRIWPDAMVLWLERENLRRLTKDPNVPKEERDALKQVLARQLGWGRRWINE